MEPGIDIVPTNQSRREALKLAEEILRNLELSEIPLTNIAMKASRLARLLNDHVYEKIFRLEVAGYPGGKTDVTQDLGELAEIAGRIYAKPDSTTKNMRLLVQIESIEQTEQNIRSYEASLAATTSTMERRTIREHLSIFAQRISSRRALIYEYATKNLYELKYSRIADDIFVRNREAVDRKIGLLVPEAVQKFTAIYDYLQSENPEDWSNAVHSCRRILQSLADAVFPPVLDGVIQEDGKQKSVKLGKENYINRIMAFAQNMSESERFREIVGSHLSYLGERLDSIYEATNKGSHETIVSREEADRYVIYTYLLVGDLLSLKNESLPD